MAKDIVIHDYDNFQFGQLAHDTQLGKQLVPKSYVNLTAMCQGTGKLLGGWLRLKTSKRYVKALAGSMQISIDSLLIVNESIGSNDQRGTWGHPDIAVDVARWISPEFQVWANRTLRLVIVGDFAPKTTNAAIAQLQLKQHHDRILNQPEPWERMYTPEFCTQVYAWYGPQFYWTFCYCFLSPVERCKIDQLNPPTNGNRKHRIHQFLPPDIKEKLTPYLNELLAIICMAKGDKQAFIVGYGKHFGNADQLEMF